MRCLRASTFPSREILGPTVEIRLTFTSYVSSRCESIDGLVSKIPFCLLGPKDINSESKRTFRHTDVGLSTLSYETKIRISTSVLCFLTGSLLPLLLSSTFSFHSRQDTMVLGVSPLHHFVNQNLLFVSNV